MSKKLQREERDVRVSDRDMEARIREAKRLADREAALSHIPEMEYNSPLSMIKGLVPEGWDYCFIRTHIGPEEDPINFASAEQEGWEVVSPAAHPELHAARNLRMSGYSGEGFFYKGALLCARPKSIGDQRKNFINKKVYEEIINLGANAPRMGAELLRPGQFMEDTRWSNSDLPYEAEWGRQIKQ